MRPHVHLDGPSFFIFGMEMILWLGIISILAIVLSGNWIGKFFGFIK